MKNLWDDRKSITLTRIVVALAIAGSIIMTVCGPRLVRWMVTAHTLPAASGPVLLGMGYLCAVLALVMLCTLYQLLCGRGVHLPASGCVHLSAVCLSGSGGRVYGAHCPGAEKRL